MRPSILYPLFSSVEGLKGVGEKYARLIKNLCGEKIIDVLFHLPVNTVDRTYNPPLREAADGRIWTGVVTVTEHQPPQTRKHPYRIYCTDGTAELVLVFFKIYADSLEKNYPVGARRAISGKLEFFNGMWQMSHPDYSVSPEWLPKIARLEPVYPLTAGVTNKMLCRLAEEALQRVPSMPEWLLPESLGDLERIDFKTALNRVHHPKSPMDLYPSAPARKRLAYDEILSNQLALALIRQKVRQQKGRSFNGTGVLYQKVLSSLPFQLTAAQEEAAEQSRENGRKGGRPRKRVEDKPNRILENRTGLLETQKTARTKDKVMDKDMDTGKDREIIPPLPPGEDDAGQPPEPLGAEPDSSGEEPSRPRRRKPSTLTKTQEVRFNRFWAVYPKKVSLGDAERAWAKIEPSEELTDIIVAAVEMAKRCDTRFREARYTPHPASWLNNKSWENQYNGLEGCYPPVSQATGSRTNTLGVLDAMLREEEGGRY